MKRLVIAALVAAQLGGAAPAAAADLDARGAFAERQRGGFDLSAYPAVQRWMERVAQVPRHVPMDAT